LDPNHQSSAAKNSTEGSRSVKPKEQQYKIDITVSSDIYEKYRFFNSSDMAPDVPEGFGDYGYCFFTHVSCPLDNSDNSQINEIRCMGNNCNKNSTIEEIFGSTDEAITKLIGENRYRCLESMEDTVCNRCISCNSTHRSELVAGQTADLRECRSCPASLNLNLLENQSEHTLTYLILGK
jgi:hypothetical protein